MGEDSQYTDWVRLFAERAETRAAGGLEPGWSRGARTAGLILAEERSHVPFHCRRLHAEFARWPRAARRAAGALWRVLLRGTVLIVALDHGPALRQLGVGRRQFVDEVTREFAAAVALTFGT